MIKIIRRCQNSRLVKGFHPLFHESVVAPLFVGVLWVFVGVFGCLWVLEVALFGTIWLKHAPGTTWQGEKRKSAASSKMTVRQQLL